MEPFMGMIAAFGFNFAPYQWALCNGQTIAISQNAALFSLLGTYYGGNGVNTFQLPDLQGRMAIGQGNGRGLTPRVIGENSGTETVSILTSNMPQHSHAFNVSNNLSTTGVPGPTLYLAKGEASGQAPNQKFITMYSATAANAALAPGTIGTTGGSTPLGIMPPFLTINYSIALQGIFPSRN